MLSRTTACRRVASTQLRARRRAHSHSHVCLPPRRRAHSHSHEHLDSPGDFNKRETGLPAHWRGRDWRRRAFTVGIGGPVGSGKTALTLQLCRALREKHSLAVVTCVEINQCVGCTRKFFTKSFLDDDAAVLARSSGEEPASPRHRADVASMAWRTTR